MDFELISTATLFRQRLRHTFNPQSLTGLSLKDQHAFEVFGQGQLVPLPFENIQYAFRAYVQKSPETLAALSNSETDAGQVISYGDLDAQSDALALYLLNQGVRSGDRVGLFLQRSIDMLVGIMAIMKAGAAYVPQDARIMPVTQLRHISDACKMKVILTQKQFADDLAQLSKPDLKVIAIERNKLRCPSLKQKQLLAECSARASGDDVCFVLFTSGTTGQPNGVQVTHKNLCNILLTQPGDLGMRPGKRVSQILNISFDMAAWEILGALSHGSTLVIRGKEIAKTVRAVDIVIATPSILSAIDAKSCQNVQMVAVAGEPCPRPLADEWAQFATFYNCCGPTEVTIVNTMQLHNLDAKSLPIGGPTPNNTVYILDESLKPCAIGEIGEMWAGGSCVSRGYLNNPSLTEERYKPDPFLGGDHKMFRTRDLGRWTAKGELEHFGRTDDQVKIRGFRVELDSVSSALESAPGCLQSVTLKLDSQNLVAFVRPSSVDIRLAQEQVSKALPYYCSPSFIITMDEFPKTSRGKIDKRALTILAVRALEATK